ncbi:phosphoglycerate mutase-like protein [Clathrospora elynae]|uniref:Phosphoglycerate mutase-like protein n=1 Tax=Clathrospora elynae TaxID=706981 RepID=A0A6A5SBX6_9PLEO|nr:phosphoglycerate mutase-like protein [Clathrospora elynae]
MARSTRLFLIRHGETVDNVAQLYAGSRDSALTNHGFQQATRLGLHFRALGLTFTHLFSSHLQRAARTAGKIREAQSTPTSDDGAATALPDVVHLPLLMEQDFGSMEGKKWHERPPLSENKDTAGFVDVESKDAMARRADAFLDGNLLPLLGEASEDADPVIAIVSHGIFLSTIWKCLLLRLPRKSVALSSEVQATAPLSLEHLGGWSNTGYLELHMAKAEAEAPDRTADALAVPASEPSSSPAETPATDEGLAASVASTTPAAISSPSSTSRIAHGWTTTIMTINGKEHLKALKRTRGGVGSSRHDDSQKSIETFFKRRKVE